MSDELDFQWSDFDDYLTPALLAGKPHTVTIERIAVDNVFNPYRRRKEPLPLIWFEQFTKPLPMTPARRKAIISLFGDNPNAALGKIIDLRPVRSAQGNDTIQIAQVTPRKSVLPESDQTHYEPILDAESTAEQLRGTPAEGFTPPPALVIPSHRNGDSFKSPTVGKLVQARLIAYAKERDYPGTMFELIRAAGKGGFHEEKLTNENFESFTAALENGLQIQEEVTE